MCFEHGCLLSCLVINTGSLSPPPPPSQPQLFGQRWCALMSFDFRCDSIHANLFVWPVEFLNEFSSSRLIASARFVIVDTIYICFRCESFFMIRINNKLFNLIKMERKQSPRRSVGEVKPYFSVQHSTFSQFNVLHVTLFKKINSSRLTAHPLPSTVGSRCNAQAHMDAIECTEIKSRERRSPKMCAGHSHVAHKIECLFLIKYMIAFMKGDSVEFIDLGKCHRAAAPARCAWNI